MFYSPPALAARPCPRVNHSLLKLLRLHRLKRMIKSLYRKFPSMELVITGLELLVTMTLVAHWMACLWYVRDAVRHALFCCTAVVGSLTPCNGLLRCCCKGGCMWDELCLAHGMVV